MVFVYDKCKDIWFTHRLWEKPLRNCCPHCGTIHYNHQTKKIEEIEEMIKWREEEKSITNSEELFNLKRMLDLEILIKILNNLDS
jgi:hypothetical protein